MKQMKMYRHQEVERLGARRMVRRTGIAIEKNKSQG